jgi:hypothetical protein
MTTKGCDLRLVIILENINDNANGPKTYALHSEIVDVLGLS